LGKKKSRRQREEKEKNSGPKNLTPGAQACPSGAFHLKRGLGEGELTSNENKLVTETAGQNLRLGEGAPFPAEAAGLD